MHITYIGHATLLIEIDGATVLTDPNFEPRLGGVLPRVSAPGIAVGALPKLDAVLLTHAHADHLSFDALNALPNDVPVYAPPAVERWLAKKGYRNVVPLPPGEETRIGGVTLRAAAARHMGNRYLVDRWRGATNMYLLDAPEWSAFFAGDTALTGDTHGLVARHLHDTGRELDLALLPIGHAPWWKPGFRRGHLTTGDALELFDRLRARILVPYHWGTFHHVTSRAHDAITRLREKVVTYPRGHLVKIIEPGQTLHIAPPAPAPAPGTA